MENLRQEQERLQLEEKRQKEKLKGAKLQEAEKISITKELERHKQLLGETQKQLLAEVQRRKTRQEEREKQLTAVKNREPQEIQNVEIGPKRYSSTPAVTEEVIFSATRTHSLYAGIQMYHKKSTELQRNLYREQFPSKWSTSRLLAYFRSDAIRESTTSVSLPSGSYSSDVKLVRYLGLSSFVVTSSTINEIRKEIEESGDKAAMGALKSWISNNPEVGEVCAVRSFEAKVQGGSKCLIRMYTPAAFMMGLRASATCKELLSKWKQRFPGMEPSVPVVLGAIRPDGTAIKLLAPQWTKSFSGVPSPYDGELWVLYQWELSTFKSLRNFPDFPQQNKGFAFGNDHTIYNRRRWRFVCRLITLSLNAVDFIHDSGFCHNALSLDAIWISTLSQTEENALHIKVSEFTLAQRLSDSETQAEKSKAEDFYQLGLVFLTLLIACFTGKVSSSAKFAVLNAGNLS